jgi:hypothetical protein
MPHTKTGKEKNLMKPGQPWHKTYLVFLLLIVLIGTALFSAGLMRGMPVEHVFHPDSPKQVMAVWNYIHGKMLWRMGSWFYDGYPYGLNLLDAGIIRVAYLVITPVTAFLNPDIQAPQLPERAQLYYWCRMLRVLYGVGVILLTTFVARRLTRNRWLALLAALIVALSPLTSVGTHAVTGDIGVDLFAMAALAVLCLYRDHPRAYLLSVAAFFCGFGFACKFQGALVALVFIPIIVGTRAHVGELAARFARRTGLCALGFLSGAVVGTPGFWIDPHHAWRAMRKNFIFIQEYNTPKAFLEKPLFERISVSLSNNFMTICSVLGWSLLALALIGLAVLCIRAWCKKTPGSTSTASQHPAFIAVLFAYPIVFLLLSVSLKPMVQPFHFSHLIPILAVNMAVSFQLLWQSSVQQRIARLVGLLLVTLSIADFLHISIAETQLWRRPDIRSEANAFAQAVFTDGAAFPRDRNNRRMIRRYAVEANRLTPFRNREFYISHKNAAYWLSAQRTPTPTTPCPGLYHWIFMHGPTFPRNDRMFLVTPGRTFKRDIVTEDAPPDTVSVGLRSDFLPCEIELTAGGEHHTIRLNPFTQVIREMTPEATACTIDKADNTTVFTVPLSVRTSVGNVTVSVLANATDQAYYQLFGGKPPKNDTFLSAALRDLPAMRSSLSSARFYSERCNIELQADETSPLTATPLLLPAGAYRLELVVLSEHDGTSLGLQMQDSSGLCADLGLNWNSIMSKGLNKVTVEFTKPFAPYAIHITATANRNGCSMTRWDLRPDVRTLSSDINTYYREDIRADWMHRTRKAPDTRLSMKDCQCCFDDFIRLKAVMFPTTLRVGETFTYSFVAQFENFQRKNIHDLCVFVHLRDTSGNVATAFEFSLQNLTFDIETPIRHEATVPDDLPPGEYELVTGVYNTSSKMHLRITDGANVGKDTVTVQKVQVTP